MPACSCGSAGRSGAALDAFAPEVLEPVELGFGAGAPRTRPTPRVESISIDYAVMEPAAAAGQVVMGSMDVGWNDLGSWTSLLGELGMPGVEATIDPTGEAVRGGPDDLAGLARRLPGRLSRDARLGRYDGRGGRDRWRCSAARARLQSRIEPLLDRCSTLEAHS